ncbi:DUF4173 domain-containing protein [Enterovirga rhinocerotis]|uniref:Uncharacterized protein DUF4173 n=1 Tax=Enterovirga rhinocerotis TaxID=1339210 RepID=A0A4R7BWG7_9HYPH|nr:DUF4173 domain-containing protein [Enterovirga rhinocerotis]TDR89833.1 uncharacterized protein DUF4173 [Enterovirga rhinocerotis]
MTPITTSEPAKPAPPALLATWPGRIFVAAILVALGDWLFYRQHDGVTAMLFALALGAALLAVNDIRVPPRRLAASVALLFLACLPGLEHSGALSLGFAYLGLALVALLVTRQEGGSPAEAVFGGLRLLLSGPWRLIRDATAFVSQPAESRPGGAVLNPRVLAGWIVPVGLLAVFALLFADANPFIETWLRAFDPVRLLNGLSPNRVAAWGLLLLLVWPFLEIRLPASTGWHALSWSELQAGAAVSPAPLMDVLLGRDAIARSLVLFNLLFAVQTAMDATFLWGGVALPEGMTYASYAHRGAYPLVATALLAAGFVLAAMRPGGPAEEAPWLRALVYLFVAQNVGLVLSSILRLDLYVSVYSLTYWRVAAFIWMGLVLIGLVLIALRIRLRRSNSWLVGANLIAATAVLYACSFVNVANLVASYNVAHQPEETRRLDLFYLVRLGPQAIPAIDRALPTVSETDRMFPDDRGVGSRREWLLRARQGLAEEHRRAMADWRRWSLRGAQLSRYLDAHPQAPTVAPAGMPAPAPAGEAAPVPPQVESGEGAR